MGDIRMTAEIRTDYDCESSGLPAERWAEAVFKIGESDVFGANWIAGDNHLIPNDESDFGPNDHGTPLNTLGDGRYRIHVYSLSQAPADSEGFNLEACSACYIEEIWFFEVTGGVVGIPYQAD